MEQGAEGTWQLKTFAWLLKFSNLVLSNSSWNVQGVIQMTLKMSYLWFEIHTTTDLWYALITTFLSRLDETVFAK